MDPNCHGLIVGINRYNDRELSQLQYAEKDARDIYDLLTNPEIGMFPPSNVDLLLGEDAKLYDLQQTLVDKVIDRNDTDTVLIYFAGHAVSIGEKIYLVPSDISREQIEGNKLKYISMSLDSLRDNVFRESQAKNIVFILDTCYSGSMLPKERGNNIQVDFQKRILDSFPDINSPRYPDKMRTIFVSSQPLSPSMESNEFQNGIFTHYLLSGLQGGAVDKQTGEVTTGALFEYVQKHMTEGQTPGEYFHGYGKVVLVRYQKTIQEKDVIRSFSVSELEKISARPEFSPFTNSLEKYYSFIQTFIGHLENNLQTTLPDEEKIVDALRLSTNTEVVLVLDKKKEEWGLHIKNQGTNANIEKFIEKAVPILLAEIQAQSKTITKDHRVGSFSHLATPEASVEAIAIPLNLKDSLKVLIFCGDAKNIDFYKNDMFVQVITGIYSAVAKTRLFDPMQIEAFLLDYLKVSRKQLPIVFYDRRKFLFLQRLKRMSVRYQPIIYLGMDTPFVCGFETLASDPKTNTTPLDLLSAAEIWGTSFKIDLDCYFFETAILTYKERLKQTPGYHRPQDIMDLSINVYPETLLRTAYYSKVEELIKRKLIPNYRLYLEISEKSQSPEITPGDGIAEKGMVSFRDILKKYVKNFRIGFAIDDFGVGYSSVARLGELTPSYIKIDREILKLENAYDTIKFTVDYIEEIVSGKHLSSSKVVLEGFDEEIARSLSLGRLMKCGIQFIQSYIIGMPTDQIVRLNSEQRDYLVSLMNK